MCIIFKNLKLRQFVNAGPVGLLGSQLTPRTPCPALLRSTRWLLVMITLDAEKESIFVFSHLRKDDSYAWKTV